MSYGLRITNPSGVLVLAETGFGLNYIGKAVLYSNTPTTGMFLGSQIYRITSPGQILVFLGLQVGNFIRLMNVTNIGGNVWEIQVQNATATGGTTSTGGFQASDFGSQLASVDVFCYARPTTKSGNVGLAIYDAAGVLAWDLSRPKLLQITTNPQYPTATTSVALGGMTYPAVLGSPGGYRHEALKSGATYRTWQRDYMWTYANGTLDRAGVRAEYFGTEDTNLAATYQWATEALVLEANGFT